MTPPPDPVAALAEALYQSTDLDRAAQVTHDRLHAAGWSLSHDSERDALVERVARLIDDHGWDYGDDEERESLRAKAIRAAIEGRP